MSGMVYTSVLFLSAFLSGGVAQDDDWQKRDEWQYVSGILYAMGIDSSSVVADIGCQEGYLTVRLAPLVRQVFAVDIDATALKKLRQRSIPNVTTVLGGVDNPNLPTDAIDAVVILNAYHEMDKYEAILSHVFSSLRHKGRLVIVEPISQDSRKKSRRDQTQDHKIGIEFVRQEIRSAGFRIVGDRDPFVERKERGDQMWILVSEKP